MTSIALKHTAIIISGQSPPSEQVSDLADGLPFIQGNAEFGRHSPRPHLECSVAPKRAHVGDLLISVRAPVGALNWADRELGIGRGLAAIMARPGWDSRFIAYSLTARMPELQAEATGSTFEAITADDLGSFRLAARPTFEQRRIAEFLDDRVARIDQIIAARMRQLSLADELSRASIDSIFQPSMGEARTRLARLAGLQTGLTVDAGRNATTEDSVQLPYLRVANVQADRIDLTDIKEVVVPRAIAERSRLRSGDVLMTEGGDLDKLGRGTVWTGQIEECLHQNHVFAVRTDRMKLLPEYLALFTRTSSARQYFESTGSKTTNLASTNSTKVLDLPIPVWSLDEQGSAVRKFESHEAAQQSWMRTMRQQRDLLTEYKQSLITSAVTGELDVTTAGSGIPR